MNVTEEKSGAQIAANALFQQSTTKANEVSATSETPINHIEFHDPKGQWNSALSELCQKVTPAFTYNITKWKINFSDIRDILEDHEDSYQLNNSYQRNKLHVFIAPITWAAIFYDDSDFIPYGPAFASMDDIKLYKTKKRQNSSNLDGKLKIAVIEDKITSTIALKILLNNLKIEIEEPWHHFHVKVECETHANPKKRYKAIYEGTFDAAIFTTNEIQNKLDQAQRDNLIEILNIDHYYSFLKHKGCLPRTVYCIHKCQVDDSKMENILSQFKQWVNKIEYDHLESSNFYSINPKDENFKKLLKDFLIEGCHTDSSIRKGKFDFQTF